MTPMADFIGYRFNTPMTKILDRLYLGGFKNAEELTVGNVYGISCIVNCTCEPLQLPCAVSPRDSSGFHIIQLDQLDGHPWHRQTVLDALAWTHAQLRSGRTVLVHCHAGISRSPVLTAGYLYTCGYDFEAAFSRIQKLRPEVCPCSVTRDSMKTILGIGPSSCSARDWAPTGD